MIRYSGDTEIHIRYDRRRGVHVGLVKDPVLRFRIIVPPVPRSKDREQDARNHDRAARQLLAQAMRWAGSAEAQQLLKAKGIARRQFVVDRASRKSGSRIRIRRVYQAPCPLE